jgi:tetratricopeptide (TPR) repeat protein
MPDTIATTEDAAEVHRAAREAIDRGDHALAYGFLVSLHDAGAVIDAEMWTEVRYELGECCAALHDPDSARRFYDEAAMGQGEYQWMAVDALNQLDRMDAATAGAADGVDQSELSASLTAAADAQFRDDYETAMSLYQAAYRSPALTPYWQGVVCVGMGQCLMPLGRYDEAREWMQWALNNGDHKVRSEAKVALAAIEAHAKAVQKASDGANASDMRSLFAEADAAYKRGDAVTAIDLYTRALDNPVLDVETRGQFTFNLGQAYMHDHDYERARAAFEAARATGAAAVQAGVRERLEVLDRMGDAVRATQGNSGTVEP